MRKVISDNSAGIAGPKKNAMKTTAQADMSGEIKWAVIALIEERLGDLNSQQSNYHTRLALQFQPKPLFTLRILSPNGNDSSFGLCMLMTNDITSIWD